VELSKEQKQAIADGFEATLKYNSMASKLDPNKLFSVEPMCGVCSQKQRKHGKHLTTQQGMPETQDTKD